MKKKILFISFYFEPDLCACSFRNSPLAYELARQASEKNIEIDVITTFPNRYSSYAASNAPEVERNGNLSITRVQIPSHKSGIADQIKSFAVYFSAVNNFSKGKKYDLIYASSGRLFTAFLGYYVARKKRLPLYLDIRDIFVDTIKDVFPNPIVKFMVLPFMKIVEKSVFNYATHVNLISGGFKHYFAKYKKPVYTYFTNGIDPIFLNSNGFHKTTSPIKTILYAGNIGEGQGLHKIVPETAKLLEGKFCFKIIGDGGARVKLQEQLKIHNVNNVELVLPVNRETLIEEYHKADFFFIHLNNYEAFKKVLPSKVFELGVYSKPLIAGVNGYSRQFIQENLPGSILIQPCDSKELVEKILAYKEQKNDRTAFITSFKRDNINKEMASSILSYI